MRPARSFRCLPTAALVVAAALPCGRAWAQEQGSRRDQLAKTYLQDASEERSIYGSEPVNHIVPNFNTITYAVAGDLRNIRILPSADDQQRSNAADQLQLTGYTFSPYLALSLKRIGLGFAAESGSRTARYSLVPDSASSGQQYSAQESQMTFTSVGAFLYVIPFEPPPWLTTSLVLGGRSYNAKHTVSPDQWGNRPVATLPAQSETFTYNVNRYEVGCDVGFHLVKSFVVIPWLDYTVTDAAAATAVYTKLAGADGRGAQPGTVGYNLNDDIDLFWFDAPRLKYGIDIAVEISDLVIHFGDALGAVSAFGNHGNQIKNQTLSVSVALKQKAH